MCMVTLCMHTGPEIVAIQLHRLSSWMPSGVPDERSGQPLNGTMTMEHFRRDKYWRIHKNCLEMLAFYCKVFVWSGASLSQLSLVVVVSLSWLNHCHSTLIRSCPMGARRNNVRLKKEKPNLQLFLDLIPNQPMCILCIQKIFRKPRTETFNYFIWLSVSAFYRQTLNDFIRESENHFWSLCWKRTWSTTIGRGARIADKHK